MTTDVWFTTHAWLSEDTGSPEAKRFIDEQTRGFEGVTGSISFTRESHVPEKTVWVIRMQSGERTLAAAVVPESVPAPIVED